MAAIAIREMDTMTYPFTGTPDELLKIFSKKGRLKVY